MMSGRRNNICAASNEFLFVIIISYVILIRGVLCPAGVYSADTRPVADQDDPLRVLVQGGLLSLDDVSETDQTMTTTIYVDFWFLNNNIKWNSSEYNLTSTLLPIGKVYVPRLKVENDRSHENKKLYSQSTKLYFHHCGLCAGSSTELIKSSCGIDITYYPFDSQRCDIDISVEFGMPFSKLFIPSPSMQGKNISLKMADYSDDGSWDIIDQRAYLVKYFLRYSFLLQRKTTYYILSMLLPLLFLSCTTTVVFALPTDSGEKMGTSITVLLAYSFYHSTVTEYLPDTSLNISLLGLYLTILFGFCTLSVVATATVVHFHFKSDKEPVGKHLKTFTQWVQRTGGQQGTKRSNVQKGSVYSVDQHEMDSEGGSNRDGTCTSQAPLHLLLSYGLGLHSTRRF